MHSCRFVLAAMMMATTLMTCRAALQVQCANNYFCDTDYPICCGLNEGYKSFCLPSGYYCCDNTKGYSNLGCALGTTCCIAPRGGWRQCCVIKISGNHLFKKKMCLGCLCKSETCGFEFRGTSIFGDIDFGGLCILCNKDGKNNPLKASRMQQNMVPAGSGTEDSFGPPESDKVNVSVFDKQDKIPFVIMRWPHANSCVPKSVYVASYVSGLLSLARVAEKQDFMATAHHFITQLKERRGYVYSWARLGMKKLYSAMWFHDAPRRQEYLKSLLRIVDDVYKTDIPGTLGLRGFRNEQADCHINVALHMVHTMIAYQPELALVLERSKIGKLTMESLKCAPETYRQQYLPQIRKAIWNEERTHDGDAGETLGRWMEFVARELEGADLRTFMSELTTTYAAPTICPHCKTETLYHTSLQRIDVIQGPCGSRRENAPRMATTVIKNTIESRILPYTPELRCECGQYVCNENLKVAKDVDLPRFLAVMIARKDLGGNAVGVFLDEKITLNVRDMNIEYNIINVIQHPQHHYTCNVKKLDGTWVELDDMVVRPLTGFQFDNKKVVYALYATDRLYLPRKYPLKYDPMYSFEPLVVHSAPHDLSRPCETGTQTTEHASAGAQTEAQVPEAPQREDTPSRERRIMSPPADGIANNQEGISATPILPEITVPADVTSRTIDNFCPTSCDTTHK